MRDLAAATNDDEMFAQARKLFATLGARETDELEDLTASEWAATP